MSAKTVLYVTEIWGIFLNILYMPDWNRNIYTSTVRGLDHQHLTTISLVSKHLKKMLEAKP